MLAGWDALADAPMWPGRVIVRLIVSQHVSQMGLAEDQDPVQEFAAQGFGEPLAGRVHPRCLDSGAHDRGAGGLEDSVEGAAQVRSAVADQEPELLEPPVQVMARLRACWVAHSPVGWAVTPPKCIWRLPCSMNTRTYSLFRNTVSTCRKSTARIPVA